MSGTDVEYLYSVSTEGNAIKISRTEAVENGKTVVLSLQDAEGQEPSQGGYRDDFLKLREDISAYNYRKGIVFTGTSPGAWMGLAVAKSMLARRSVSAEGIGDAFERLRIDTLDYPDLIQEIKTCISKGDIKALGEYSGGCFPSGTLFGRLDALKKNGDSSVEQGRGDMLIRMVKEGKPERFRAITEALFMAETNRDYSGAEKGYFDRKTGEGKSFAMLLVERIGKNEEEKEGILETMKYAYERRMDNKKQELDAKTPFMRALEMGDCQKVRLIEESHRNHTPGAKDGRQNSAMHFAVLGGNVEAITFLLDRGYCFTEPNADGKRPNDPGFYGSEEIGQCFSDFQKKLCRLQGDLCEAFLEAHAHSDFLKEATAKANAADDAIDLVGEAKNSKSPAQFAQSLISGMEKEKKKDSVDLVSALFEAGERFAYLKMAVHHVPKLKEAIRSELVPYSQKKFDVLPVLGGWTTREASIESGYITLC
jgi:hypothetical protein